MDDFQYINNTLEFLPHTSTQLSTGAEGYIKATPGCLGGGTNYHFNYVFTYTDHLGNIRLIDAQNPSNNNEVSILEEDHYYPYGLKHVGYNGNHQILFQNDGQITLTDVTPFLGDSHTYKFGGKEYQTEFDINSYDFGARNYDPALGRWMNIDPLAEYAYTHSPYSYAFNNPIYYIDPDGRMNLPFGGGATGAMETMSFGGGDGLSGGGEKPDPQFPGTSGVQKLDEVVIVAKRDKGCNDCPATWGNGTEDLGRKLGTRKGDFDINDFPISTASGPRTTFLDFWNS